MKAPQKNPQEMSDAELAAAKEKFEGPPKLWQGIDAIAITWGLVGALAGGIVFACGGGPVAAIAGLASMAGGGTLAVFSCRYARTCREKLKIVKEEIAARDEQRWQRRQEEERLALAAERDRRAAQARIVRRFETAAHDGIRSDMPVTGPLKLKPVHAAKDSRPT